MAQVIQETAAPCLHNQSFTLSAVISTLLSLFIYVIIYLSIYLFIYLSCFQLCGLVCVQSLWAVWREEKSIFRSLHELSIVSKQNQIKNISNPRKYLHCIAEHWRAAWRGWAAGLGAGAGRPPQTAFQLQVRRWSFASSKCFWLRKQPNKS